MPPSSAHVTAADIARLAGVTRATVSNWRRRHSDFPAPSGGSDASPAYDLPAVRAWLAARGQLPEASPLDELRSALRAARTGQTGTEGLLALVLGAADLDAARLEALADEPGHRFAVSIRALADGHPRDPAAGDPASDPTVARWVLRALAASGPLAVADVLARESPAWRYGTPEPLAALMAELLAEPGGGYPASVLDPACGNGDLLLAAGDRLAAGRRRAATNVYGQEIVPIQADYARLRLAVQAPGVAAEVRAGDSLRADAFGRLAVDAVLCAPPYGDRSWGHDELAYDERWRYGVPPKLESELAWVQHCLAHLAPGGRAVVLLPPAVAERPSGRRIRAELVRAGTLRAVIALPPRAAEPLHIGLHLWLLESAGQPASPPHVLFVDATGGTTESGVHWPALRTSVVETWRSYQKTREAVPGARAVPVLDLLDASVDLNPMRRCRATVPPAAPDEQAAAVGALRARLETATNQLARLAAAVTATPTYRAPEGWRTASVADLARGGALTLLRAQPGREDDPMGPRTLTARDVTAHRPASGEPLAADGSAVLVREGDVILPEILGTSTPTVRVATAEDAGAQLGRSLHLLRPDPDRLDPWFLAGFLAAPENLHSASVGSTIPRLDARRLRVPLMALDEQRRYASSFRHLASLERAAAQARTLAVDTASALRAGLTSGALTATSTEPATAGAPAGTPTSAPAGRQKGTR